MANKTERWRIKKKKMLFITKQNFQIISVCMRQVGSSSYINVFNDNFSHKYQELSGKMLLALHYFYISASILLFLSGFFLFPHIDVRVFTSRSLNRQQCTAATRKVSFIIWDIHNPSSLLSAVIDFHFFVHI